jgi:hypothetical protein
MSGLLCCVVGLGAQAAHAQRTFAIRGTVEGKGRDPSHTLTVLNARVWVMKALKSKEVSDIFGDDDRDGRYKLVSLEERDYDLVACEGSLRYKPKSQKVHVPSDNDVPFVLENSDRSNGLIWRFERPTVIYLKHIDTGCKPPPIRTEAELQIPLDPGALDEQYAYCREPADGGAGTYETCIQSQLRKGRSDQEVNAAIGPPERIDRVSGTYFYTKERLQITFEKDHTVSSIKPIK